MIARSVHLCCLLLLLLGAGAALSSCAPGSIEGEVLDQQWSDYECEAAIRIPSGDAVRVRFVLAVGNRAGFEPTMLRRDSLTGKRVRCELGSGYTVKRCTLLLAGGDRILRRIGERE